MTTAGANAAVTQRIGWVDSAKGVAILMIAVHHTLLFLEPYDLVHPGWLLARDLFATFPMPLFFLASGILTRRSLAGTWGVLWRRTLLPLLWLYVVWSLVRFVWFLIVPLGTRPEETSLAALAVSPLLPQSGLWYLHALALCLVLARLARGRVPAAVQVGVALVLSVASFGPLSTGNLGYEGLAHYLVFFLVGAHGGGQVVARVERASRAAAPLAVTAFVVAVVLVRLLTLQWLPVVPVALSALAVAAGVLALHAAPALAHQLRLDAVGAASLPVYVTHVLLIGAATRLLLAVVADPAPTALRVLVVPAVVAFAVSASLLIALALRRTPLRALYRPPDRWTRAAAARTLPVA